MMNLEVHLTAFILDFSRQKSDTNSEQLPVGEAPEQEGDFQEQPRPGSGTISAAG